MPGNLGVAQATKKGELQGLTVFGAQSRYCVSRDVRIDEGPETLEPVQQNEAVGHIDVMIDSGLGAVFAQSIDQPTPSKRRNE